jgi:hypothetical protein
MSDFWGSPEIAGDGDALDPEYQITQAGGITGPLPSVGTIYWCRVNETSIGRYRAVRHDDEVTGGGFKAGNPLLPVNETITFCYQNLDGVDNSALFESLASPAFVTADWQLDPPDPTAPPTWTIGTFDTFASPAELRPALGAVAGEVSERRLGLALIAATRWVLHQLGYVISISDADRGKLPPDPAPLPVTPIAIYPVWRKACLIAAVRFYQSEAVPFGVAGGWDMATYVRMSIPDADLVLIGPRMRFGIA